MALTVVCGSGLFKEEGASPFSKTGESSFITPRLSKTLEGETRQSVTNCVLLKTDQNKAVIKKSELSLTPTRDSHTTETRKETIDGSQTSVQIPRVRRPTENLAAVFDEVLVAVRVLDSVFSRPGPFNLDKMKWITGFINIPKPACPLS